MTLHLVGIFHTPNDLSASHCAFTGKVFRFAKMMEVEGFDVIEYANESQSEASHKVNILTREELSVLAPDAAHDWSKHAVVGSPVWHAFSERLEQELLKRYQPGDFILHPFGTAHSNLVDKVGGIHLETGIGYCSSFAPFRIYESYCWLHHQHGKEGREGSDYEWVIPNYFDLNEWTPQREQGKYLLYLGRICSVKGLRHVQAIAAAGHAVTICGQGDPTPFLGPNVTYLPPVSGRERDELVRNAKAMLMPTRYIEPFGGAGVEGLLCGTPLLSSNFGAFAETVIPGFNGFRCQTLGDWLTAIDQVGGLNRTTIAQCTRATYSLESVGPQYTAAFRQIADLHAEGWYTKEPRNIDLICQTKRN